jgi:uncharacterized protein (DUF58 family)
MIYPTRSAIVAAMLGIPLALLLGVFAPGFWLWGVAWLPVIGGLILADTALATSRYGLRVEPFFPDLLSLGHASVASFQLTFAGRVAPLTCEVTLDADRLVRVIPQRAALRISARDATANFTLEPLRRGEALFDAFWVRWHGPLGMAWKQRRFSLAQKIPVVMNIGAVRDMALRFLSHDFPGLHVRPNMGAGAEFHSLTEFQQGMDRRTLDWKQSARHGVLLAKEYQAEQNQHIVIAIDTGRLMSEPLLGQPRLDRALQAALLLAFVSLKLGDRIGLFAFDEKPRLSSGTLMGTSAFGQLQRLAAKLDYSTAETNFTLGLTQLGAGLEHRSIIVVFTDFSDTTSAQLMVENIARLMRRHMVLFVAFRDEDLEAQARGKPSVVEDVTRAVIADSLMRERDLVIAKLQRMGVDIVDVPTSRIGEGVLAAYLAIKERQQV